MSDNTERDQLRDELSGWPVGSGYYQSQVGSDEAGEMADAILSSDWLARVKREAAAAALDRASIDCANSPTSDPGTAWFNKDQAEWLSARAAEYREGQVE